MGRSKRQLELELATQERRPLRPVYRGNYGGGGLPPSPWSSWSRWSPWSPGSPSEMIMMADEDPEEEEEEEEEKEESIENIVDERTWEAWKDTMHLVGDALDQMSHELAMFLYCKLN